MHVLVTGAGGFSGAEVTVALLGRGHRVTACVHSARGRLPPDAEQMGALDIIVGDLANSLKLPDKVDAIVHAAARSPGVGVAVDDLLRDNVFATHRLVSHAIHTGVRIFIYLSSLSVYGRIETAVVDEATPVLDPEVYGLAKRLGEELLSSYGKSMSSLAIRLPGVIGRGSVRNWLTNVLSSAQAGREIAIFNSDAPFNNAVHVADLGQFICGLLEKKWDGFDAITVGAAGEISVGAAVRLIVEAYGQRSNIRNKNAPMRSFVISSARARDRYGYCPMEITSMLRRFVSENMEG